MWDLIRLYWRIFLRSLGFKKGQFVRIPGENISRELIIKIHGRCNLKCTYCYMYESVDQSWREKPEVMSDDVIRQLAKRLGEYMREHRLSEMRIVLHGGEPLKAGLAKIRFLVETLRAATPGRILHISMQTNGTMINEKVLDLCLELGIAIGVSLDGNEAGNVNRPLLSGRSSYAAVKRGLRFFDDPKYRHLLQNILVVVNLNNDPVETFEEVLKTPTRSVDFLLPLGHWSSPPPGSYPFTKRFDYAIWLGHVYERWLTALVEEGHDIEVRYFKQIHNIAIARAAHGRPIAWNRRREVIGPWVVGAIVIETDGTYELLDGLKTVKEGEAATGLNVFDHYLTKALVVMLQATQERGIAEQPKGCKGCPIWEVCGGGFYLHRWGTKNKYDNPSVYCADLQQIIPYMLDRMWPLFIHEELVPDVPWRQAINSVTE